jgi:hypothetical protein
MTCAGFLFASDFLVDRQTGLMWQDSSESKSIKRDWERAKVYCADLVFAGFSDWRLPSIKELQSIVDVTKYKPAIIEGFKNITSDHYWSSTRTAPDSDNAWYVQFENGFTFVNCKSEKRYVRCVRGYSKERF